MPTAARRLADQARRVARAARTPIESSREVAARLAQLPTAARRACELENENAHLRALYETWVPSGHRSALARLPWVATNPGANISLERVG